MNSGESDERDWPQRERTTWSSTNQGTQQEGSSSPGAKRFGAHIGIYGWRKRCLYCLMLLLLIIVVINITLTLWIFKVMQFSSDGMGNLKIVKGGVQLDGRSIIMGDLFASLIRSREGRPLLLESFHNFTVNVRNEHGAVTNSLVLQKDKVECRGPSFSVSNPRGDVLFSVNKDELVVGAEELKVTGAGGAVFDGSVQTPLVRADSRNELRLESPTRYLEVLGPLGVAIESRAGDISASSLSDLKLQSVTGAIRLEASKILMPQLPIASVEPLGSSRRRENLGKVSEVYQLCICGNGKLFLAPSDGQCSVELDNLVCL